MLPLFYLKFHQFLNISGTPDIAKSKSYLEDANIFGGEEEVAARLSEWTPTPAQFTNGLVVELYRKFGARMGTRLSDAFVQKVVDLVGADDRNVNRESSNKIRNYMRRTQEMMGKNDATLDDKWVYLDRLTLGGDLQTTLHPPSSYQRLLARLNGRQEQTFCHSCGESGDRDRLFSCRACLAVSYCSRLCQRKSWEEGGHKLLCKMYASDSFGEEAKEAPYNDETISWMRRATLTSR